MDAIQAGNGHMNILVDALILVLAVIVFVVFLAITCAMSVFNSLFKQK